MPTFVASLYESLYLWGLPTSLGRKLSSVNFVDLLQMIGGLMLWLTCHSAYKECVKTLELSWQQIMP